MVKHKARVVFAPKVWDMIEWFTHNLKTEIGALGRVTERTEDGEKYFYVDKLWFPKQYVTGATVHFTHDMWGDLIKEVGLKDLTKAKFYWHRHPGSAAHSGTDDEDTFDTFMSKEAKRPYFIFLQTACSHDGKWDEEYRIDIRKPIRATITNDSISGEVETKPADADLIEECEKIRDTAIQTRPTTTTKPTTDFYAKSTYSKGNIKRKIKGEIALDGFDNILDLGPKYKTIQEAVKGGRYGEIGSDLLSFDNDVLCGYSTDESEKLSITFEDGQATIIAGENFQTEFDKQMKRESTTQLSYLVRQTKKTKLGKLIKYNIQPMAKKYKDLRVVLAKLYFIHCQPIIDYLDVCDEEADIKETKEGECNIVLSEEVHIIEEEPAIIDALLGEIDNVTIVDWVNTYNANVTDYQDEKVIGDITVTEEKNKMFVNGKDLITLAKESLELLKKGE